MYVVLSNYSQEDQVNKYNETSPPIMHSIPYTVCLMSL